MTQEVKMNLAVWPIEKLVPYALNSKKHDKSQVKKIAASIREFGWNQPISVDKDGVIIGGHGRRLAVQDIVAAGEKIKGWPDASKVPVWIRDDLTPEQVRALRLADNKVAESEIDTELFRQELASLDFDLSAFFSEKELDFAVADLGTVNMDAFITDVGAAVKEQEIQTKEKVEALQEKVVPLNKAFGFPGVKGSNQLVIARFMAIAEAKTGKVGEEALIEHMQACLQE